MSTAGTIARVAIVLVVLALLGWLGLYMAWLMLQMYADLIYRGARWLWQHSGF